MKRRLVVIWGTASFIGLLLIGLYGLIQRDQPAESSNLNNGLKTKAVSAAKPVNRVKPVKQGLPDEQRFELTAESDRYTLRTDPATGHFKVESKSSGRVWRSYPDPAYWEEETASGVWRSNFLSPVIVEYIDASSSKSQTKLTNWVEENGVLDDYKQLENGFQVVYRLPVSSFTIPLEVRLVNDYVEVKVIDSRIQEGPLSLLNLKAFPQFGAQPSKNNKGFLLLPDGSGSLVRFDENRSNDKSIYREPVYGADLSFYHEITNRNEMKMPIFGLKSGEQAFLGVMTEGEEYAKLFAAPAGSLGLSNWVSPEWQYRIKFFQNTDRRGREGFYTFSKERFEAPSRQVRYYLLEGEEQDTSYAAMASRYRQYLIEERGLARLAPQNDSIPFYADIIGADLQQGILWDDYIAGTTTKEAEQMVSELQEAGITNITAIYHGWQRDGYSSYGGLFPVDRRLGGNKGMKSLADKMQDWQGQLWLSANYSLNNTRRGGFWNLNDGLRNLAGTLQEVQLPNQSEGIPVVSPLYSFREAEKDIDEYKKLGVDGVLFTGGIGSSLHTDFNSRNKANRVEVRSGQQQVLKSVKDTIGFAAVDDGSFYSLTEAGHIHRMSDDYSYDIFMDEAVPFAQIALHGLTTYTSEWGNLRDEYVTEYLRSAEFGAYPAYVFTAAPSDYFKKAYSVGFYSMNYKDWIDSAAAQYEKLNAALSGVQDQYITNHRELAPGVKQTIYENGQSIIVNYNEKPYQADDFEVPAQDFIVKRGGLK